MPALLEDVPAMLDDVGRALATVDPAYAEFLSGARLTVSGAAQVAVQELVEEVQRRLDGGFDAPDAGVAGEPDGQSALALALFEEAGRDEFRQGRPLRTLLLAYQTGVQVAWRHIAAVAVRQGVPAEALAALAEAVFRAVDRISAVTTSGYLAEQNESAGMREQLRTALAEQLLTPGADRATVEKLALQAGWSLPAEAALVLVRAGEPNAAAALARLSPRSLQGRCRDLPAAIIPDPAAPGARKQLRTSLRGCPAVVGPTVPVDRLPDSAAVVRDAMWLLDVELPEPPPVFAEDHLDTILVHRDERLLEALRARCLAPLDRAANSSRQAFQDTLRSWLLHMGDRRAVARELQVHPQTVRYRVSRLHELFGPVLDDPRERLRLLLSLGWDAPVRVARPPQEAEPRVRGRRAAVGRRADAEAWRPAVRAARHRPDSARPGGVPAGAPVGSAAGGGAA